MLERWCREGRVRVGLVVAALLSAGGAGQLSAQDSVSVSIDVQGIDGVLEKNVRAMLELARAGEDGKLPRARVQRLHEKAEQNIRTALEPFGYYSPSIEKSLERSEGRITATYVVTVGPVVRIRDASVAASGPGAKQPEFIEAVDKFPLRSGDSLSHLRYEAGKIILLTVALDSGYLDAGFDSAKVAVDRDAAAADIMVRFRTGDRFRFGPVRFEQDILDEKFLRSRIPFKQGEPWRQDKLLELQAALSEDPYFSMVEVSPMRAEAKGLEVPVKVALEPRKRAAYEFGLGYGTDTGPRGRVMGQFRRVNRRGHHAGAEAVVALREQSVTANYNIPAFGHPTGTLTFQGGFARLDPTTSTSNRFSLGTSLLRKRIGWRETLSLNYQHESFSVGVDSGVTNLLIAGGSWERTRTNDRIYPTSGLRTRVDLQGSQKGIVASNSFLQLRGSAKALRRIAPSIRVLGRVEVAQVVADDFRELPPTLRLFAGGDQSVRGFDYQELGPTDEIGNVIGGQALLVGSLEVDYRFLNRWAIAVFTDAGNATRKFTFDGLEQSVGIGARFLAPIGMVRLDAAFGISRRDPPFRLHLSIGPDL